VPDLVFLRKDRFVALAEFVAAHWARPAAFVGAGALRACSDLPQRFVARSALVVGLSFFAFEFPGSSHVPRLGYFPSSQMFSDPPTPSHDHSAPCSRPLSHSLCRMARVARALDVIPFQPAFRPVPNRNLVIDFGSYVSRAMRLDLAEGIGHQLRLTKAPPRRIISAGGRRAAVFIELALPLKSVKLAASGVSEQHAAGLRARTENPLCSDRID
jgi:hypothetical protein